MNKDVKIGLAIGLLLLVTLFVWFAVSSRDDEPAVDKTTGESVAKDPADETISKPTPPPKTDYAARYHDLNDAGKTTGNEAEVDLKGKTGDTTKPGPLTFLDPDTTPESKFYDPGGTTDTTPHLVDVTDTKPPATTPVSHVVKSGETLSTISQALYGSAKHWPLIARANDIDDPVTQVRPDMVLKIPPLPTEVTPAGTDVALLPGTGEKIHTVVRDDTLSEISQEYYGTMRHWKLIARANKLEEDAILRVDSKLLIPKLATTVTPAPTLVPGLGEKTHVVKQGDTLQEISRQYYGTVRYHKLIQEANNIADPLSLRPGQTLLIPRQPAPGTTPDRESAELRLEPGEKRYVVQEDETLSEIAERELGSKRHYPAIMKRNNIADARDLRKGQVIILPSLSVLRRASSVTRED